MKKTVKIISVVCAIVMLLGILPVMSVSAADAATLVVTPSSETVKVGREFTLTFTVKNNTGLSAIAFDMPIDTNVFEFVEATSEGMIFINIGFCEMDSEGTAFKFLATSNGRSNVTADGFLAKLTLRAKEDVALGNYAFSATIDKNNTLVTVGEGSDISEVAATVANASTSVKIVDGAPINTIASAQVNLGTDISVSYFVDLDRKHVGAQMKFTFNEEEILVDGVATGNPSEYEYVFTGIAPQAMGDNLKAELVLNGTVIDVKEEYSVLANCQNLLSKTAKQLGLTNAQYSAMKTLIADLLVYGAKAQLYVNYNTTALVDANVTGATALGAIDAENDVKYTEGSSNETVAFTAAGVFFDYTNSLYFKFTAPGMTESNLKIVFVEYNNNIDYEVVNSVEYTLADCELIDEATSTYKFTTDAISVIDYGTVYSVELQVKSGRTFSAVQFLDYNVNSYAYSMQNSTDAEMADLAKALYNYGVSAAAFQNSFNG